jgi:hypothetical protein
VARGLYLASLPHPQEAASVLRRRQRVLLKDFLTPGSLRQIMEVKQAWLLTAMASSREKARLLLSLS